MSDFDRPTMTLDQALAHCEADPRWVKERDESRAWSEALAPILSDLAKRAQWKLLEFSPEVMELQHGDPTIAFQCELDGWVIRADYIDECGPDVFYWKAGGEDRLLEKYDDVGHGTTTRDATEGEVAKYGSWLFYAAFLNYAADHILPPPSANVNQPN